MMRPGVFVPEIHDVSSAASGQLSAMLALLPLDAQAVAPLLVVPRWGGERPITECRELVAELTDLPGEKVLHGFTHTLGPSAWNHIVFGTENESEFAGCTQTEALGRLRAGSELFGEAFGYEPRWFCAPRWHAGRETALALRQIGIRGRMLRTSYDVGDASFPIEALWFDDGTRAVTRTLARHVRARRLQRILSERRPFRLVLHPRDAADVRARYEIRELVAKLLGDGWQPGGLPAMAAA
ncbi:MAG: DUF2334 domain-containing protein [Gemmatimonadaceae bacterium]